MKKKLLAFALFAAIGCTLAGCGGVPANDPQDAASEAADAARQDGDRFETVIMLESMEETVRYEHVRNEAMDFELDYDYEILERYSEEDRECFLAQGEDPEDPWNYFELRSDTGNANLVADALKATLSGSYDTVTVEESSLERAGACLQISASGAKDALAPAGSLQTVYVIPAGEGCLVATVHCTYESAEGFGARASYMLNTLAVIH